MQMYSPWKVMPFVTNYSPPPTQMPPSIHVAVFPTSPRPQCSQIYRWRWYQMNYGHCLCLAFSGFSVCLCHNLHVLLSHSVALYSAISIAISLASDQPHGGLRSPSYFFSSRRPRNLHEVNCKVHNKASVKYKDIYYLNELYINPGTNVLLSTATTKRYQQLKRSTN